MPIRTKSLFHFTKSFSTLAKILEEGKFRPSFALENIGWLEDDNNPENDYAFSMVSFCDIPITRLVEHTNLYGDYGIGLKQEWGLEKGLNPVLYMNNHSTYARHIMETCGTLLDQTGDGISKIASASSALFLLAYAKPIRGWFKVNGIPQNKEFYSECEWRYIPEYKRDTMGWALNPELFENETVRKEHDDEIHANHSLTFLPQDIRYIFVKNRDEIPQLIDVINGKMGDYSINEGKVLYSHVTSLQELQNDL